MLGIIENGAVVQDEKIIAVGTTAELKAAHPDEPTLDANGKTLIRSPSSIQSAEEQAVAEKGGE
ncbi:MAG TPA: hypothetical protein VMJ90_03600 [Anaerolineales bacterium]|nr:hypothetical protein [Anaerolineales bacterium]